MTLVELIMVIVIMVTLAAISIPAVMWALRRSQAFAVQNTISELDAAVEKFKTTHGFYPPDFSRIKSVNQFLPYLNQYSPQHSELSQAAGYAVGIRRIDVWWDQVGKYLGPESALAFWLSGIAQNKQFPLTFVASTGAVNALPPYNIQVDNQVIERDLVADMKGSNLIPVTQTLPPLALAPAPVWAASAANTCGYSQQGGEAEPLIYFELASYRYNRADPASQMGPPLDIYPHRNLQVGNGVGVVVPMGYVQLNTASGVNEFIYYKADRFQIFGPGIDSTFYTGNRPWVVDPAAPTAAERLLLLQYSNVYDNAAVVEANPMSILEKDNLTNFLGGPLEGIQLK